MSAYIAEKINAYSNLVRSHETNRLFERYRHKREDNIKLGLKDVTCGAVD
jgi:hypothetical protein